MACAGKEITGGDKTSNRDSQTLIALEAALEAQSIEQLVLAQPVIFPGMGRLGVMGASYRSSYYRKTRTERFVEDFSAEWRVKDWNDGH
jgi:hypothetical protein